MTKGNFKNEDYYQSTWGFDPRKVRHDNPSGDGYVLEDGFPLDAPGDEILDALGVTLWARVEVDATGDIRNRLFIRRGNTVRAVTCVHFVVHAASKIPSKIPFIGPVLG